MFSWFKWKYLILFIVILIIGIYIWQYRECKKKGNQSGVPYRCGFMNSIPLFIIKKDEYYDIKYGKCYHFIDYDTTMTIRETEMENCK